MADSRRDSPERLAATNRAKCSRGLICEPMCGILPAINGRPTADQPGRRFRALLGAGDDQPVINPSARPVPPERSPLRPHPEQEGPAIVTTTSHNHPVHRAERTTAAPVRCHCGRHTAAKAACRYQVMNTTRLFPVLGGIERDFTVLCEQETLGQLPTATGPVPLADLGAYLTCALTDKAERDRLWRVVLERGRESVAHAPSWRLAALGLALPRLIHIALRARSRESARLVESEEITAEMLASFTDALRTIDLAPETNDPIVWRLARAGAAGAQRAADRAAAHHRRTAASTDQVPEPAACTHARPTHPDIALARLVKAGVIDASEAELIGRHRIEQVTLRQLCTERGWYPMQGTRALRVAEAKVARALGARDHTR